MAREHGNVSIGLDIFRLTGLNGLPRSICRSSINQIQVIKHHGGALTFYYRST